jgi:hypothetical protein
MNREEAIERKEEIEYCESVRPPRDVVCQKKNKHKGKHRAVIFWEDGLK